MNNSKKIILTVLVGLVGAAFVSFVYQQINGLSVTGLNLPVVWGAYIVNFTFFMGIGAGLIILLGLVQGDKEVTHTQKCALSFAAFVSLAIAGVSIIMDLGRVDRFYYMMIYPQIKSPLFWDFVSLQALIGLSLMMCALNLRNYFIHEGLRENATLPERILNNILTVKPDIGVSEILSKISRFGLILVAAGFYLVTTGVFIETKAHPQWHNPIVSFNFLLAAVICAAAVILLVGPSDGRKKKILDVGSRILIILLAMETASILVKYFMDLSNPLIGNARMLFPFALFILLLLGNIIPIIFLAIGKRSGGVAALILVMAVLKRAEAIVPAYFTRWLPFAPEAKYIPTAPEILIVLGTYSAAVLVMMGLSSYLKLNKAQN